MSSPHSHVASLSAQTARRLGLSLGITLAFVGVEVAAGVWGNSLALLTDAAHNATDVAALALSWYAVRLTARPAHSGNTYGYHRAGILAALANAVTLAVIAIGIFFEAYRRLLAPPVVNSSVLIGVGTLAFLVNLWTAYLVHRGSQNDLNLRAAFLHLMGDVVSTFAAVLAGIAIAFTGFNWLDPLVSALIGVLILWNGWGVLREAVSILLESTPGDVDMGRMVGDLMTVDGVRGVHDLHLWSITQRLRALSAHIVTDDIPLSAGATIRRQIGEVLQRNYGIAHATLQLECLGCAREDLYCELEDG